MATSVEAPTDRSDWGNTHLNRLADAVAELQGIANGGSLPFNVKDTTYAGGAKGDGVTDDSAAVNAALAAAYAAGGGTVYFPRGSYLCTSLVIPNDGAGTPTQPPLALIGCAPAPRDGSWTDAAPAKGSVLILNSTTGPAKIDTRGLGVLKIDNLAITQTQGASDTNPFLQTTNTTVLIGDGVGFYGHSTLSGATCVQDAIILGGTSATPGGASTSAFQGYGTVVGAVYFARIRRAAVLQAGANGITFRSPIVSHTCGASDNSPAFDIRPPAGTANANMFITPLVEATFYTNAFRLAGNVGSGGNGTCQDNVFVAPQVWDTTGAQYCFRIEQYATQTIAFGLRSDTPTANFVNDVTANGFYAIYGPGGSVYGSRTFQSPVTLNALVQILTAGRLLISPTGAVTGLTVTDDASGTTNIVAQVGDAAHGHWDIQNAGVGVSRRILKGYDNSGNVQFQVDPNATPIITIGSAGPTMRPAGGAVAFSSAITRGLVALAQSGGGTKTPNAGAGDWQTITVSDATAFTVGAPTNPPDSTHSQELVIEISNTSGGAMGAITWNAAFKLVGGAFTNPATANKRFIRFQWNGTAWVEMSRAAADYT